MSGAIRVIEYNLESEDEFLVQKIQKSGEWDHLCGTPKIDIPLRTLSANYNPSALVDGRLWGEEMRPGVATLGLQDLSMRRFSHFKRSTAVGLLKSSFALGDSDVEEKDVATIFLRPLCLFQTSYWPSKMYMIGPAESLFLAFAAALLS